MYKYSIIMPVYNAEKTLHRSISSVLSQSYENWELMLVNDGSNDSSLIQMQEYEKRDPRIHVLSQKNQGPGIARNNGMSACTGDYICFLDADDYWDIDFLNLIEMKLAENKTELIFVSIVNEYENSKIISIEDTSRYMSMSKDDMLCEQMTGKIAWGGWRKVTSKELIGRIKCGFSEDSVGEEAIFSFELLNNAQTIGAVEKPIYHYVHNPNGQHKAGQYDPWRNVVRKMEQHLIDTSEYEKYKSTLNSLALIAFSISVYRYTCAFNRREAVEQIKLKYADYNASYDFSDINMDAISKTTKVVLLCSKLKLFTLLYIASRIRMARQDQ